MFTRDELLKDVLAMDEAGVTTDAARKQVLDKLLEVTKDMSINPGLDKPSALEAKTGVLNALLKTANDIDDSKRKSLKAKSSLKTAEDDSNINSKVGKMVSDLYTMIQSGGNVSPTDSITNDGIVDTAAIDAQLDKASDSIEVTEGEVAETSSTLHND